MERFISFLRGINVGGQKKIPMEALRTVYERLGFTQVRTYLQSGNIIFDSPLAKNAPLADPLAKNAPLADPLAKNAPLAGPHRSEVPRDVSDKGSPQLAKNASMAGPPQERAELANRIESAIQGAYGFNVSVFIRQAEDLKQILSSNPFLKRRKENVSTLHVIFLYHEPPAAVWRDIHAPTGIADEFIPGEAAIYLFCPQGYGRSRLSNSFFERKLGMPVTVRNWNTVNALYQLVTQDNR